MLRLARWCFTHRRIVVLIWIVALVGVGALSSAAGSGYVNNLTMPGKGSQQANDLLKERFPAQAGDSNTIVIHAKDGTIFDADVKAQVAPMLAKVAGLPHVTTVVSPYDRQGAGQVSQDKSIAFAQVDLDKRANELPKDFGKTLLSTARTADGKTVQIEGGGQTIERAEEAAPAATEGIGVLAAVVILLLAFGSVVAMGLPLLTALLGLGIGLSGVAILSNLIDTADFAPQLGAMIGLGVGVDYALFIVTRFRDAYKENGGDVEAATLLAMDTAGRAVLFAGATVVIALLGMLLLGVNFLYGVALAASLVVLLVMLSSLTMTPALLGFWGKRIGNTRRDKRQAAKHGDAPPASAWVRWSAFIARHPWPIAAITTVLLLALCLPALGLRLGSSDAGNNPTSSTTRKAYDLLAEGFGPGFNGPLVVAAETGDTQKLLALSAAIAKTPGVEAVTPPQLNPAKDTAVLRVYPTTSPQDEKTTELVKRLRDDTIPGAQVAAPVYVGGLTAAFIDLADLFSAKLPLFIGVVVLLSALLLMLVFRSLVIPLQAAAMNLLSIGASMGVVVLVFQEGFLGGPLGIEPGPIQSFLPVMLFAIVFGLSMDYEVFLVSRIREEWARSGNARQAVGDGLSATGRVVTAAAAIMICVFAAFIFGDNVVIKSFGLGLAVAVFVDAVFIRCLLLPAVLHLCGETTWKIPAWLDRAMPHMNIEGAEPTRGNGRGPSHERVPLEQSAGADSSDAGGDPDADPVPVGRV